MDTQNIKNLSQRESDSIALNGRILIGKITPSLPAQFKLGQVFLFHKHVLCSAGYIEYLFRKKIRDIKNMWSKLRCDKKFRRCLLPTTGDLKE